jgi:hydrogenase maturation protease
MLNNDPSIDEMMKTLVLGIGSPIMSDDSIGLRVAEEIRSLGLEEVDVQDHSTSGLDVIEIVLDYERVIVVDAIITKRFPPGTSRILTTADFSHTVSSGSPHEINIFTAIELGKSVHPGRMPKEIVLVAVEVADVMTVSEDMSPEVERAIPSIVEKVRSLATQESK